MQLIMVKSNGCNPKGAPLPIIADSKEAILAGMHKAAGEYIIYLKLKAKDMVRIRDKYKEIYDSSKTTDATRLAELMKDLEKHEIDFPHKQCPFIIGNVTIYLEQYITEQYLATQKLELPEIYTVDEWFSKFAVIYGD